jgi:hypothetical protein
MHSMQLELVDLTPMQHAAASSPVTAGAVPLCTADATPKLTSSRDTPMRTTLPSSSPLSPSARPLPAPMQRLLSRHDADQLVAYMQCGNEAQVQGALLTLIEALAPGGGGGPGSCRAAASDLVASGILPAVAGLLLNAEGGVQRGRGETSALAMEALCRCVASYFLLVEVYCMCLWTGVRLYLYLAECLCKAVCSWWGWLAGMGQARTMCLYMLRPCNIHAPRSANKIHALTSEHVTQCACAGHDAVRRRRRPHGGALCPGHPPCKHPGSHS